MPAPRLSVIVTTHLRPEVLPRALLSLTALGPDVQIVLCADEASQTTRQIAADHLRDHDIFLAVPGLRGPSQTRNLGLGLAQGDYVAFLDDDDTMDAAVLALLPEMDGTHVLYAHYRKIFEVEEGSTWVEQSRVAKRTTSRPISALMVRNFLHISCFFAPRAVIRNLAFRSDLAVSEDWEFLVQLYKAAPFRHLNIIASNWHIQEGAASRNKVGKKMRVRACKAIYQLHPVTDDALMQQRQARLDGLGANRADEA
jgi:GalNAc5-diNAcBac-PP-undecaprenol beta-1,3-glucosyltransferase